MYIYIYIYMYIYIYIYIYIDHIVDEVAVREISTFVFCHHFVDSTQFSKIQVHLIKIIYYLCVFSTFEFRFDEFVLIVDVHLVNLDYRIHFVCFVFCNFEFCECCCFISKTNWFPTFLFFWNWQFKITLISEQVRFWLFFIFNSVIHKNFKNQNIKIRRVLM